MSKNYPEEEKKKYAAVFCKNCNFSVKEFSLMYPSISKSSIYKWTKIYEPEMWCNHIQTKPESYNFVDVSSYISKDNITNKIDDEAKLIISVSGVSISLDSTFNEDLLIKVVRSLKKV